MKILIITQWFEPEFTLKGLLLAKELQQRGNKVEILTGFPNYPEGKLYHGYKLKPYQRENIDGISIIRCALYPNHDNSAFRRALNFLSFAFSATFWGACLCQRPDIIYAYHPPITIGIPAIVLSWLKRAPFVLDVQDFWPDTLRSTGMLSNQLLYNFVGVMCRIVYLFSSRIVVLSPGFKRLLVERGVPKDKVTVIYNWADERYIQPIPYDHKLAGKIGFAGKFNIVFAGNFGRAQNLAVVLDAAMIVKDNYPDIRFVLVGTGVEEPKLKQVAIENNLTNVVFKQRRPISEIQEILATSDVLLLHLKDDPLFEITIPSKTQANLCVGRPILAVCRGDAVQLIEDAGAGLSCPPGDAKLLAEKIVQFYEMKPDARQVMGSNGSRYYAEKLSLAKGVENTLSLLQQII